MSKVEELRQKYPSVTTASFNKFLNADTTATKKYLDFMLKTWEDRKNPDASYRTVGCVINAVKKFNDLLPFITNKDIYSKEYYGNLGNLRVAIGRADELREEKTFVREEHANVLMENEQFLFVQPLTHRGSIKYGANTKWCTTGKNDPATFNKYYRNGLLVYLIDKTESKVPNFRKVAFYHEYSSRGLNDSITLYNTNDNQCNETNIIQGGWSEDTLFELFMTYRYLFGKTKEAKKNKDYVDSFVNTLTQLDFVKFEEHLSKLEQGTNVSYISKTKEKVESFLESLNKSKYGIGKTEN